MERALPMEGSLAAGTYAAVALMVPLAVGRTLAVVTVPPGLTMVTGTVPTPASLHPGPTASEL